MNAEQTPRKPVLDASWSFGVDEMSGIVSGGSWRGDAVRCKFVVNGAGMLFPGADFLCQEVSFTGYLIGGTFDYNSLSFDLDFTTHSKDV